MTDEEIKAKVHFRTVDVPCCGNCKWFGSSYSDTFCKHPDTQVLVYIDREGKRWDCEAICPDEHNVCDLFEEGEYKEEK